MPHGFANLGGADKPEDGRDIQLGAAPLPVYTFTPQFTNLTALAMPVEYQGNQPACGAHSGGALKGIKDSTRYSPRFTWADIKTFDGNPIESGTDMRSIFKSITKTGPLDFALLGNDAQLALITYAKPLVTAAMRTNATKHNGLGYGFITDKSFNGLKQFIFDNGPCIVLLRVGAEWWTDKQGKPSWAEADIMPLRTPSPVVSGHFVVAHSYDEQYVYFLNSFGPTWGRQGHGYFGANYMVWVNDAGTLFPLAFKKDLQQGMVDPDVKRLQIALNKNLKTQVAPIGNGSPGHETENFGPLTYAAVQRFQALYSIKPTSGYVGPLTRAVLNGFA